MFGFIFYILEQKNFRGMAPLVSLLFCAAGALILIAAAVVILYDPSLPSRRISIAKALRRRIFVRKIMGGRDLQGMVRESGFIYDFKQDIFYSSMYPWQRKHGYCRLYDELCPSFSMIVDCEPIYFYHEGKNWLIEFWKGQYGMTTGCEIGVYTKDGPCLGNPGAAFYRCAKNSDRLFISCALKKGGKTLFKRADKHWWLTGFILGEYSEPFELSLQIEITFKSRDMRLAFEEGLKKAGYSGNEYSVSRNAVSLQFIRPRTPQPVSRTPLTDGLTQTKNFILCKKFTDIAAAESGIGKKIRSVMEKSPELLTHILNMGKPKGLFARHREENAKAPGKGRISKVYRLAKRVGFNESSKIVIISDCHRGDGGLPDDFARNGMLYYHALLNYYENGYTYIELGDGDELWENRRFSDIKQAHSNVFWLLSKFYWENRLHMLYGNHDIVKRNRQFVKNNMHEYHDEKEKKLLPLFSGIEIPESLVLDNETTGDKALLMHGHQGDFFNDTAWKIGRFLVRYFWKPLEMFGITNPTSPAKNYNKKVKISKKLLDWSQKENKMLITGHTHKPVFPKPGETLYFNSGSCVHPRCITAIEIVGGDIALVKWHLKTKPDATLFVSRETLEGPVPLDEYFTVNKNKPLAPQEEGQHAEDNAYRSG